MAACAGRVVAASRIAERHLSTLFMSWLLKLVAAVRADAIEVLQQQLPIAVVEARIVPGVLRTQSRELAGIPVEHEADAARAGRRQRREAAGGQQAAVDQTNLRSARIERIVTGADTPARQELVYALQVPA